MTKRIAVSLLAAAALAVGCGSESTTGHFEEHSVPEARPQFDEDSELELASTPAFCDAQANLTGSMQVAALVDTDDPDRLRLAYTNVEQHVVAIGPLVPNAGVQNDIDTLADLYLPLVDALGNADWELAVGLQALPPESQRYLKDLTDDIVQYGAYHCGHDITAIRAKAVDDFENQVNDPPPLPPAETSSEAPPWAQLPDGSTFVGPEFRGWTEWPFERLDERTRAELRISRFETDRRLVFLNVMSCVPKSDVTVAYGWGLLDSDGELLNTAYATMSLDWLEAPYRQPDRGSCGEGWIGVLIDPNAEPASVVWTDAWNDLQQSWAFGPPVSPEDIAPVADELTIAQFGEEAEASSGSYWAVLDLVAVPTDDAETPPPAGTTWWVAEAQYCAPANDDRIWDGLQLAVDGWYVFNPAGREIALDQTHPIQSAIPAGGCGYIWETFAIPLGLDPSHVRLSSDVNRTIWQRQGE